MLVHLILSALDTLRSGGTIQAGLSSRVQEEILGITPSISLVGSPALGPTQLCSPAWYGDSGASGTDRGDGSFWLSTLVLLPVVLARPTPDLTQGQLSEFDVKVWSFTANGGIF
jgi:hypothetical protein